MYIILIVVTQHNIIVTRILTKHCIIFYSFLGIDISVKYTTQNLKLTIGYVTYLSVTYTITLQAQVYKTYFTSIIVPNMKSIEFS